MYTRGCESIFLLVCGIQCVSIGSISPRHPASHPAHPPHSAALSHPELVREVLLTAPGGGNLSPREGGDNLVPPNTHNQCKL